MIKYQKFESLLIGRLEPDSNVTIKIIDIKEDVILELNSNECYESKNLPGVYLFNTKEIDIISLNDKYKGCSLSDSQEHLEIIYIMESDNGEKFEDRVTFENDLRTIIKINDNIAKLPDDVWNILSDEDKEIYKNILRKIYQNDNIIPTIL
jgi:hypothetical protein